MEFMMEYSTESGIASAVLCILSLIAEWRIFTKAGRAGWKCLIPLYNVITEFGFTWKKGKFWSLLLASFLVGAGTALIQYSTDEITGMAGILLSAVGAIAVLVIFIRSNYYLAKSFGHGVPFCIGLLLLGPLFRLILGLGGSEYQGNGWQLTR